MSAQQQQSSASASSLLRSSFRFAALALVLVVCSASADVSRYNRLLDDQTLAVVPLTDREELVVSKHVVKHPHHAQQPAKIYPAGEEMDLGMGISGSSQSKYFLASKREPVRRCGIVLIRYIQKLCNGCVGRPTSAEQAGRKKRSAEAFLQDVSLTEKCCDNACSDEDLRMFCCGEN